jgi:hypothetical protein
MQRVNFLRPVGSGSFLASVNARSFFDARELGSFNANSRVVVLTVFLDLIDTSVPPFPKRGSPAKVRGPLSHAPGRSQRTVPMGRSPIGGFGTGYKAARCT